jgi:hypothetical protein
VSDDNAAGERLGHLLLAMVRFVCGGAAGALLFAIIMGQVSRVADGWGLMSVLLFLAFVGVSGLFAVFFGDRFFDWFLGFLFGD